MKIKLRLIILFILLITTFVSCNNNNINNSNIEKNYLATPINSTLSYNNKYKLIIIPGYNGEIHYWTFQIQDNNLRKVVYNSLDEFRTRDRLIFMWDETRDIVWIYSGDIGSLCIIKESNEWHKYTFFEIKNKKIDISQLFIEESSIQ